MANYSCRLRHKSSGDEVEFSELSSGEQIIVLLAFWLFNSETPHVFPKLLLLDEPDAHLHPSMAKQLIDVLYGTIVGELGVRVIMTTHSPSTVALAPESSLFQIGRDAGVTEVKTVARADAISLLTDGLVVTRRASVCVLVEDRQDVDRYTDIFEELVAIGALPREVPVIFLSCGRERADESSGGRKEVEKWVPRLVNEAGIREFKGVVDRDACGDSIDRVYKLERYSIENYLLDPMVVFTALLAHRADSTIGDFGVGFGCERELCKLDSKKLLEIVQKISRKIEERLTGLTDAEREGVPTKYVNGIVVDIPKWLYNRRGKTLLPVYQQVFTMRVVNPKTLADSLRRSQFISDDLLQLFRQLQQS